MDGWRGNTCMCTSIRRYVLYLKYVHSVMRGNIYDCDWTQQPGSQTPQVLMYEVLIFPGYFICIYLI